MFKYNLFLLTKLPSAWFSGIRVRSVNKDKCIVDVKLKWFNQNPFKSMFWAVQGMAAELSTGIPIINEVNNRKIRVSMLVTSNSSKFYKKAVGRIKFECTQFNDVRRVFNSLSQENQTEKIILNSIGIDEQGDVVSEFSFEWSLKLKF